MSNEHRGSRGLNKNFTNRRVTFGEMLSAIRLCEGCSTRVFSKKLLITPDELEKIENGTILLEPKRAIEFAERLQGNPEVFVQYLIQDQIDQLGLKCKVTIEKDHNLTKSNSIRLF